MRIFRTAIAAAVVGLAATVGAYAGDYDGNFMIRLQGTEVITQDNLRQLNSNSGLPVRDLKSAGFDASVSDQFLPTATLSLFFTKNIAVELFCCFSHHQVELQAPAGLSGLSGKVAESWIFPPAVTLQYHFDRMGAVKPYVGAGAQYIYFFGSGPSDNTLKADSVTFANTFGPTLQAGVDIAIGGGWYLNADIKKSWLSTQATWHNSSVTKGDIVAKVDLDPLILSAGVGYRFNLEDLFGHRHEEALK